MNIADLVGKMPLLMDIRPDFMDDKVYEIVRLAAIDIARRTQVLERTYYVDLQCGVQDYLLDECEEEIERIKSLCFTPCALLPAPCGNGDDQKYVVTGSDWCTSQSCGPMRFRYLPENQIKIDCPPTEGGRLRIIAAVVPKFDACELDDLFASKYRDTLFNRSAGLMLEYPGDLKDRNMSATYLRRAEDLATNMWINSTAGHMNAAPRLRGRRTF